MKKNWKEIVRGVIGALLTLALGAVFLPFLMLFAWAVLPFYITQVLPVISVPALLVFALSVSGLCGEGVRKWMKRGLLVILTGCVVYAGYGA